MPYYLIGSLLLLSGVALELSGRPEVIKRRGFVRLGVVVTDLYFGWWGLQAWSASSLIDGYLKSSNEASKRGDWSESTMWMNYVNQANDQVVESVTWGIFIPIILAVALLAAFGLLFWIDRGFRPKIATQTTLV
jgi:hypothetical protein